jgi:hypothetical protein
VTAIICGSSSAGINARLRAHFPLALVGGRPSAKLLQKRLSHIPRQAPFVVDAAVIFFAMLPTAIWKAGFTPSHVMYPAKSPTAF